MQWVTLQIDRNRENLYEKARLARALHRIDVSWSLGYLSKAERKCRGR